VYISWNLAIFLHSNATNKGNPVVQYSNVSVAKHIFEPFSAKTWDLHKKIADK
jgi:hypothetical protein